MSFMSSFKPTKLPTKVDEADIEALASDDDVHFQRIPIEIRDICETGTPGLKIALTGKAFSGKTNAMCSFVYLNLQYAPIFQDKYPAVFKALKSGLIPEVESLVVVESENALENQINDPFAIPWFKEVLKEKKIKIITIETAARRDKMRRDRKVEVDIGSIEKIEQIHDKYIQVVEVLESQYKDKYNVCIGIDSGSRLLYLLNRKNEILIQQRSPKEMTEKVMDNIKYSAWEWRNGWWDEIFTAFKGYKGYGIVTFQIGETPKEFVKPGESPFKVKWNKGSEYNFDQIYEMYVDPMNKICMRIDPRFGSRFLKIGSANEDWTLDADGRLAIFPAIEALIKAKGEW